MWRKALGRGGVAFYRLLLPPMLSVLAFMPPLHPPMHSACRAVWYCGTACSHADWREGGHRRVCKALGAARRAAKEAAAAAAGAAAAAAAQD